MSGSKTELEALSRLLQIAQRDTGQSRRVANFLLAWHNAEENGGWDPADFWSLDAEIADDIVTVIGIIRRSSGKYPNDLGFEREISRVWKRWRGDAPPKTAGL
jgi:ParB family transcriptional regulator, chromosome partitioning protein